MKKFYVVASLPFRVCIELKKIIIKVAYFFNLFNNLCMQYLELWYK